MPITIPPAVSYSHVKRHEPDPIRLCQRPDRYITRYLSSRFSGHRLDRNVLPTGRKSVQRVHNTRTLAGTHSQLGTRRRSHVDIFRVNQKYHLAIHLLSLHNRIVPDENTHPVSNNRDDPKKGISSEDTSCHTLVARHCWRSRPGTTSVATKQIRRLHAAIRGVITFSNLAR